ncbi:MULTISPECIES: winged helix-turn-helix transcriptional regulator [Bradyrhizobium]
MEKDTMTIADLADATVVRAEMRRAIGAITGKWKLEILWLLNRRTHRFGELRSIPGITQHILTAQLRELEADGLISRKVFAEVPPRVEYSITPAARALKPVMDALFSWWEEFGPSPEGAAHGDR